MGPTRDATVPGVSSGPVTEEADGDRGNLRKPKVQLPSESFTLFFVSLSLEKKIAMYVRRAFSCLIRPPFRYALNTGVLILNTEGPWAENLASLFHRA